jgi:hypothetical protein
MACCEGEKIDLTSLRTPEQQEVLKALAPLLLSGIERGNTPFSGALSAPPDPSMLNAMNMMSMVGTGKPYNFPGFMWGGYPQPGQATLQNRNVDKKPNPYEDQAPDGSAAGGGGGARYGKNVPVNPWRDWPYDIEPYPKV